MSIFSWNSSFEIGIDKIDEQHKNLVNIISNLFESMKVGLGYKQVEKTINDLKDYSIIHFTDEENFMMEINFPNFIEHKEAHKYFTDKVDDFANKYKNQEIALSLQILDFLKNWLTNHILTADQEIAQFIEKQKK